jgi:hypothetical protein
MNQEDEDSNQSEMENNTESSQDAEYIDLQDL